MQPCHEDSHARRPNYHMKLSRSFFTVFIAVISLVDWRNRISRFSGVSNVSPLHVDIPGTLYNFSTWEIISKQPEVVVYHLHLFGIIRSFLEICD